MWNLMTFLSVLVASAKMYCDNQAAIHIGNNPVIHEHIKHIEVDCYFAREHIVSGKVTPQYMRTTRQLIDMFTKALKKKQFQHLLGKLGVRNLYAPT